MNGPPPYGEAQALRPGLVRVICPNPSPMTHWGTNSYLLGEEELCLIDPGPDLPAHREALLAAIDGRRVAAIVVTHSHLDHSPLARPLGRALDAPVLAFGPTGAGRSKVMAELEDLGGGEGADLDFAPDVSLTDGEEIAGTGWRLTAHHTPGHFGNHICLEWDGTLFTGDHVMGWASSLVSPPDGDLTNFMASCRKLAGLEAPLYLPGHGAPIDDGPARLAWLIAHREAREAQIREALQDGPATAADLARRIYAELDPALLPAAERNVLAHLIDLTTRALAAPEGPLTARARFAETPR